LSETAEDIDLVQQGRVLNDDGVRLHDRFAQANLTVIHAAKSHHRRTGALRAKTGKSLGMAPPQKRSDGHHLCSRDDPLAAAPVNANLKHGVLLKCCRVKQAKCLRPFSTSRIIFRREIRSLIWIKLSYDKEPYFTLRKNDLNQGENIALHKWSELRYGPAASPASGAHSWLSWCELFDG
jgi:hypothetical protein